MRYFALIVAVLLGGLALATLAGPRDVAMGQDKKGLAVATFAGGCFWCTESDFEKLPGVKEVISGYAGGKEVDPSYQQVSAGSTGHLESVQVHYDPALITYDQLLDWFWRHIDPTDPTGQFVDKGAQYRSAIFYHDEEQQRLAIASRDRLAASGRFSKPIATEIRAFTTFYPAEDYHQDYYKHNPVRYKFYRYNSGRDQYIHKVWGEEADKLPAAPAPVGDKGEFKKPSPAELRARLTPLQFDVTQKEGTEAPYKNEYWDNKRPGVYVDIVSGEPLFSSLDKYDSHTGWPSFTKPLEAANIVTRVDHKLFTERIEVRSKAGDSHLGHVFDDGPAPTGLRYCMNSAALRFVPKEDLEKEGLGRYLTLFAM